MSRRPRDRALLSHAAHAAWNRGAVHNGAVPRRWPLIVALGLFATVALAKPVYRYTDERGVVVIVDSYDLIPPKYRARVEKLDMTEPDPNTGLGNGLRDQASKAEEALGDRGQSVLKIPCPPAWWRGSWLGRNAEDHPVLLGLALFALVVVFNYGALRLFGVQRWTRVLKWMSPVFVLLGLWGVLAYRLDREWRARCQDGLSMPQLR